MTDSPEAITPDAKGQAETLRPVPLWGWVLAALFFPPGIFIAMAVAGALRWWLASVLAAASYLLMILFLPGLAMTGNTQAPNLMHSYMLLALFLYFAGIGQLQYSIGRKHGLWTPRARRMWWFFGALLLLFIVLSAFTTCGMLYMNWAWVCRTAS
jgi:hypothetical protein